MSSSELRVIADAARGGVSVDTEITLLDGLDEQIARGHGEVAATVPAGLYRAQIERAGVRAEQLIRHDGPETVRVAEPQRFSAVPANDTATSHEYYQGPAMHFSQTTTAPPLGDGGGLFIFVRAPSADVARGPLADLDLRLLDYDGTELAVLDATTTQHDDRSGWLAFHADAAAGEYVLRSGSEREMALAVFADWQTQVFLTLAGGVSFASASMLLGRFGFAPDDATSQAIDAALSGLQNGTDTLPASQRQYLLYGKFDNPMLGLVGAYSLLRFGTPERAQIEMILGNLQSLLGPRQPDVQALELLAARYFGDPLPTLPLQRPPLLRAGLEAVLEQPGLVPSDSVIAQIALCRCVDSPWSTWLPRVSTQEPEWISRYVEESVLQAARRDRDPDFTTIAERAALPVSSVTNAAGRLETQADMERVLTRARREARTRKVDPEEPRRLYLEGDEPERVRALGLMQGAPAARDFDIALTGLRDAHSSLEQFHALRVGQQMLPTLDAAQKRQLAAEIEAQRGTTITPGGNRWYLSSELLSALGE